MTIYAITIASNFEKIPQSQFAYHALRKMGKAQFSPIYVIPCRDGVGEDYWNFACLLESQLSLTEINEQLKALELQSGRIRPSHQISLDMDLIAWGENLATMVFNVKKMPLAQDVMIPLADLWQNPQLIPMPHFFPHFLLNTIVQENHLI